MRPSEFVTTLWTTKPPGLVHLWALEGRKSFYLRNPQVADNVAAGHPEDLYVGVSLAHKDHGRAHRTTNKQALAIPGFWLDIDVNGGPEDKTNAAPDKDAAFDLASSIAEPTLLVDSGYGMHAWWLFSEPWRFASTEEQQAAALAAAQWQHLHRQVAGYGLDSTHDLARLLRLPGTVNAKGGQRAEVGVLVANGPRYARGTLLERASEAGPVSLAADCSLGDVEIGRAESPVVERLVREDTEFARTWAHDRPDHADWTLSEYDMALCGLAANAGCDDQQLADVIATHRAKHDSPKGARPDYVQRTIAQVRKEPRGKPKGRRLVATPASSIRPESVRWLWADRIPLRGLTILAGEPGLGKSTLTMYLTAEVSRGALEGDLQGTPASALIVSYEDAAASVLVPRLNGAGADGGRAFIVSAVNGEHREVIAVPDDVRGLVDMAREKGARLLIVDPLTAALTSSTDSNRDASVRGALAPLAQAADEAGLAVVVVMHLRKSEAEQLLHRVSGSVGFVGAARSTLAFARHPDDPDGDRGYQRVIVHAKSNWGRFAPTLACHVESVAVTDEIETSRLAVDGECDVVSSDLISTRAADERSEVEECCEWLRDELTAGAVAASKIQRSALETGFSKATLNRAKKKLRITPEREGFGRGGQWVWGLPESGASIDAQHPVAASNGNGLSIYANSAQLSQISGVAVAENGHRCSSSELSTYEAEKPENGDLEARAERFESEYGEEWS